MYPRYSENWTSKRVLALDGVQVRSRAPRIAVGASLQDPGNVGSLIRTCACLGWGPVLLSRDCCDPFNDKVLKAARGATFRVPVFPLSLKRIAHITKTKKLVPVAAVTDQGTAHTCSNLEDAPCLEDGMHAAAVLEQVGEDPRFGICLFLGSEGQGLSEDVEALCQTSVSIPQTANMESLNVAVAGGILMYLLNPALQNKEM